MIQTATIISLLNLAIYVLLSEGYVLHWINVDISNLTDKVMGMKTAAYVQAPLYNCYVCMSSVWTVVWWFIAGNKFSVDIPIYMLLVCAISFLIENAFIDER